MQECNQAKRLVCPRLSRAAHKTPFCTIHCKSHRRGNGWSGDRGEGGHQRVPVLPPRQVLPIFPLPRSFPQNHLQSSTLARPPTPSILFAVGNRTVNYLSLDVEGAELQVAKVAFMMKSAKKLNKIMNFSFISDSEDPAMESIRC